MNCDVCGSDQIEIHKGKRKIVLTNGFTICVDAKWYKCDICKCEIDCSDENEFANFIIESVVN